MAKANMQFFVARGQAYVLFLWNSKSMHCPTAQFTWGTINHMLNTHRLFTMTTGYCCIPLLSCGTRNHQLDLSVVDVISTSLSGEGSFIRSINHSLLSFSLCWQPIPRPPLKHTKATLVVTKTITHFFRLLYFFDFARHPRLSFGTWQWEPVM